MHSLSEVLSAHKLLDGGITPSRDMAKHGFAAKSILDRMLATAEPPPCNTAVQLLTYDQINRYREYHISHAARTLATLLSGKWQACMYMYITLSVVSRLRPIPGFTDARC